MRSRLVLVVLVLALLAACASGQMYSSGPGGTTIIYSKYYDVGVWLEEGKLGLQVVIDHEMTSGPNAGQATGKVTLYLVNLSSESIAVSGISLTTDWNKKALLAERPVTAPSRARTRVSLGVIPISNYGTDVEVVVRCNLEGSPQRVLNLSVPRLTEQQVATSFGRGSRPPYPWFAAPYYPFDPPLKIND